MAGFSKSRIPLRLPCPQRLGQQPFRRAPAVVERFDENLAATHGRKTQEAFLKMLAGALPSARRPDPRTNPLAYRTRNILGLEHVANHFTGQP